MMREIMEHKIQLPGIVEQIIQIVKLELRSIMDISGQQKKTKLNVLHQVTAQCVLIYQVQFPTSQKSKMV